MDKREMIRHLEETLDNLKKTFNMSYITAEKGMTVNLHLPGDMVGRIKSAIKNGYLENLGFVREFIDERLNQIEEVHGKLPYCDPKERIIIKTLNTDKINAYNFIKTLARQVESLKKEVNG